MTTRRFGFALSIALFVAACATGGSFPSDKVLTAADAGLVTMRIDDQFSVKLAAPAQSGLVWHVLISEERMLIRQGEPVIENGIETFTYRITAGGETQLRFEYKRPDGGAPPGQVVVFDVVVD
jgi:predicted secreted protein